MLYCSFECEVASFPDKYCINGSFSLKKSLSASGNTLVTGVLECHFKLSPLELSGIINFRILVSYTKIRNCNCYLFPSLYQQTPLHVAAKEKHAYTVEWLVKKGAKVNIRDNNGVSIMQACRKQF